MGTLNIRGIKRIGKREKIEHWMNKKGIYILLLQETHVNQNVREIRKHYTWFFAGDTDKNGGKNHTEAGVAIVIHNSLTNYIWDVQSYSDRLISLTLGYA